MHRAAEHGLVESLRLAAKMREMAGYRNGLDRHYDEVTPEELFAIVTHDLGDLEGLTGELREAARRLAERP